MHNCKTIELLILKKIQLEHY